MKNEEEQEGKKSFITTVEQNEATADWTLPLHEVFAWVVPSTSCILTELSNMLLQNANSISGAPLEL